MSYSIACARSIPMPASWGMSDRPAPDVSLVVPVYNERENVGPLVTEIAAALAGRRYEIVAVDDGSTDGSLAELQRLKRAHPELHIVVFEQNAGQSAAFVAGFRAARGRAIVTLDADLQNDPADRSEERRVGKG